MGETSEVVATAAETGNRIFDFGQPCVTIFTMLALLAMVGWLAMIKGQRFDGYVRTSVKVWTIVWTVLAIAAMILCFGVVMPSYE